MSLLWEGAGGFSRGARSSEPPPWTCPSCGASIFAAQKYCDVCSPTIWKPATQSAGDASETGVGTWHLILDRRVAEERREALLTALRGLSLDLAVRAVNEREVNIASGATLQQANALMIRLHELGVISRKQRG